MAKTTWYPNNPTIPEIVTAYLKDNYPGTNKESEVASDFIFNKRIRKKNARLLL